MSKTKGAYFAPLVTLNRVVTAPGRYLTRNGEIVIVTRVSNGNDFGNVGTYPNGIRDLWHRSGRIFAGQESGNDLVSLAPAEG